MGCNSVVVLDLDSTPSYFGAGKLSQKPIDDQTLKNLLKPKEEKSPVYTRSEVADLNDRTVTTWFKGSIHRFEGKCSFDKECLSPDGPWRTVADIKGVVMCRWCFIGKRNL